MDGDAHAADRRRLQTGARAGGKDRRHRRLDDVHFGVKTAFDKVVAGGVSYEAREQKVAGAGERTHFLTINLLPLRDAARRTHAVLFLVDDNTTDITIRKELIAANTAK